MEDQFGREARADIRRTILSFVRFRTRRLARTGGFGRSDIPDIYSSLLFKSLKAVETYNPKKGTFHTYLNWVLDNHIRSMIRYCWAQKRNSRGVVSLTIPVWIEDGHETEKSQTLDDRDRFRHKCIRPRTQRQIDDLRLDVQSVLQRCRPELREFALALSKANVSQIARDRGVPRTTLHHLKRQLTRRFEYAGLGKRRPRRRFGHLAAELCSPEVEDLGKPLRRFRKADFR
jgi:RNA polymerase sigma factor (sigma-70 family)